MSCQGSGGRGVILRGSLLNWGVTAWQGRHFRTVDSAIESMLGNQRPVRRYCFVFWIPM